MPRGGGFEVLSPGSAGFMNERQGRDYLGEALVAFQEIDDEVGRDVHILVGQED